MAVLVFGGGAGNVGGDHKDTSILSTTPTRSYGSADRVYAYDAGDVSPFVALMRFELANHIPVGSVINSSVLRMYCVLLGGATNVAIHRMLTRWGVSDTDEGANEVLSTGGQATWDCTFDYNAGTDVRWAAGGVFTAADFVAAAEDTQAIAAVGTWMTFNIPVMTRFWLANRTQNYGCYLVASADTVQLASDSHATDAFRWTLTVNYTPPAAAAAAAAAATQRSAASKIRINIGINI